MLHSPIGKAGDQHQFIFVERKWLVEVVGQIFLAFRGDVLHLSSFLPCPLSLRLPDVDVRNSIVKVAIEPEKGAGSKRKKISTDGRSLLELCLSYSGANGVRLVRQLVRDHNPILRRCNHEPEL